MGSFFSFSPKNANTAQSKQRPSNLTLIWHLHVVLKCNPVPGFLDRKKCRLMHCGVKENPLSKSKRLCNYFCAKVIAQTRKSLITNSESGVKVRAGIFRVRTICSKRFPPLVSVRVRQVNRVQS